MAKQWMEGEWFHDLRNERRVRPDTPVELPQPRRREWADPKGYLPDEGLADAIRVALVLRRPLLLTGEPGTGKTECAAYLAWKLGLVHEERTLKFDAKSTSAARDLFYSFDTLGRFQAMHTNEGSRNPLDYLHYNALGEAILQAQPAAAVSDVVPPGWKHQGPVQSVVLIDEIDKAPRDFPNDLLNEIDRMQFRIPEFRNRLVKVEGGLEPVVVITSNSEKNLPAAFLRRCVYYHIPFPEGRLEQIVAARLPEFREGGSPLLRDAIEFFLHLRGDAAGLTKAPATAELLDWLLYLVQSGADRGRGLRQQAGAAKPSLVTLLKHGEDQQQREELWSRWIDGR